MMPSITNDVTMVEHKFNGLSMSTTVDESQVQEKHFHSHDLQKAHIPSTDWYFPNGKIFGKKIFFNAESPNVGALRAFHNADSLTYLRYLYWFDRVRSWLFTGCFLRLLHKRFNRRAITQSDWISIILKNRTGVRYWIIARHQIYES